MKKIRNMMNLENGNKFKKRFSIIMSILIPVLLIGISLAYYIASISGEAKKVKLATVGVNIEFYDSSDINLENASTGAKITKQFTIRNAGSSDTYYDIYWSCLENTFSRTSDLVYTLTSTNNGGSVTNQPVPDTTNTKLVEHVKIDSSKTQVYTLTIEYKRLETIDQSVDMNKTFKSIIALRTGSGAMGCSQTGLPEEFVYTGSAEEYTVSKAGKYKLQVWGAQGGARGNNGTKGANGGYSEGTVQLAKSTVLYVNVGEYGGDSCSSTTKFNGGGSGLTNNSCAGSGGGATDIRIGSNSLYSRVIVAGGGGGHAGDSSPNGGVGGGLSGTKGEGYNTSYVPGGPGTQTEGGTGGIKTGGSTHSAGTDGTFGIGGNAVDGGGSYKGSGGGGGWYGGGGGVTSSDSAAGGGGSGWIFTSENESAGYTNPSYTGGTWLLTSSHYLINASTTVGNQSCPTHNDLSTMTGNAGDGYAKITYLGN